GLGRLDVDKAPGFQALRDKPLLSRYVVPVGPGWTVTIKIDLRHIKQTTRCADQIDGIFDTESGTTAMGSGTGPFGNFVSASDVDTPDVFVVLVSHNGGKVDSDTRVRLTAGGAPSTPLIQRTERVMDSSSVPAAVRDGR